MAHYVHKQKLRIPEQKMVLVSPLNFMAIIFNFMAIYNLWITFWSALP